MPDSTSINVWHAHHTEHKGSRYKDPIIYANGSSIGTTQKGEYGDDLFLDYITDFIDRKKDDENPFFVYWPMASDARSVRAYARQSGVG